MYKLFILLLTVIILPGCLNLGKVQNVYQKINSDSDLSSFNNLLSENRIAKLNLKYKGVTVFVPENAAFQRFNGIFDQQLTYYHISYEVKSLQQLALTKSLQSTKEIFPPIWITSNVKDIYVNNARIIQDRSDSLGKTRDDETGEIQMLHVIDEVLDPFIRNTSIEPTAYQLLSTPHHWSLSHTLELFFERVADNGLSELYQQNGSNTYFIPIDENIDDHRYKHLDNYTIQAHIIPKQVLFTRPANKNFFYETACNGDYIYILASFISRSDKLYAKSTTVLGDTNHAKGEILAEIIKPNIPVKNGVVHLISKPLVIFDRHLNPFPFLPVFYKIESDPFLDYSYRIGENTDLNDVLRNPKKKVTYFVPRNEAWKKAFQERSFTLDEQKDILSRHIILDETTITMERLLYLSESSSDGNFILKSMAGDITLNVVYFEDSYYVSFNGSQKRVLRADYMCEDGVVHVLESPFFYDSERYVEFSKPNQFHEEEASDFWSYLRQIFRL